jgi:hypothetical protein
MDGIYNKYIITRSLVPKWYWLFLWIFPTFSHADENYTVYMKRVFGRIYIVGEESHTIYDK